MKFADLDKRAKARARDEARDWNVDHDWWDYTYEDVIECGKLLGIEITNDSPTRRLLFFRLNYCQGDGACFAGSYVPVPDPIKAITEHRPRDEALLSIAKGLAVLQLTSRLIGNTGIEANIVVFGNGCHSNCMMIRTINFTGGTAGEEPCPTAEQTDTLESLMRRFADWIFERLRDEYEYLTSDECIDEALADHEFDEDGSMI
jgi:hypothetical protein